MFKLTEGKDGAVYTVQRVKGGGRVARPLEERAIMAGSDVKLLSRLSEGGVRVETAGREVTLSALEAESLLVDEQLVRRESDPVFLGGCCAYGCTARVWDEYINGEKPQGSAEAGGGSQA